MSGSGSSRSGSAAAAARMNLIVRGFFAAAGLIALLMVIYVVRQEAGSKGAGAVGLVGFESLRGDGSGPKLPPRERHSHGGAHGESEEGGHKHDVTDDVVSTGSAALPGSMDGVDVLSAGSGVSGVTGDGARLIEKRVSRVERRITRDDVSGTTTVEETIYYTAKSEEDALALAGQLVKDGRDVVIREGSSSSGGGAGAGGRTHEEDTGSGEEVVGQEEQVVEEEPPKQQEKPAAAVWAAVDVPGWLPNYVGRQRPVKGEADVTSHTLEEASQHSMNPPRNARELRSALSTSEAPSDPYLRIAGEAGGRAGAPLEEAEVLELENRIVVAIALGVHSGSMGNSISVGSKDGLSQLPIARTLLGTLLPVAQPHILYRFYFAYDHNDPVYEKEANRKALEELYASGFDAEDAKRWHPPASRPGVLDGSRLAHSVHWVHCDYSGKPSWAHSDAVVAAYKEGADYTYRTNDDSAFPSNPDWADKFITELRGRAPVPNLGVVGPTCHEGASWILTHDFTHKTHVAIFGWQYPRGLPDWSSDDWVTYIYAGFSLMSKLPDVTTGHTMSLGTRYNPTDKATRLSVLNSELQKGSLVLNEWLKGKGVTLPYTVKTYDCC